MKRLTALSSDGTCYYTSGASIRKTSEGYTGEAIERLALFEAYYTKITAEQNQITADLEHLRAQGKDKTAKFRELLGKKLINNNILISMEFAGIK